VTRVMTELRLSDSSVDFFVAEMPLTGNFSQCIIMYYELKWRFLLQKTSCQYHTQSIVTYQNSEKSKSCRKNRFRIDLLVRGVQTRSVSEFKTHLLSAHGDVSKECIYQGCDWSGSNRRTYQAITFFKMWIGTSICHL
jgi:hypothetical protein